jgi:hypothetical protein
MPTPTRRRELLTGTALHLASSIVVAQARRAPSSGGAARGRSPRTADQPCGRAALTKTGALRYTSGNKRFTLSIFGRSLTAM